MNISDMFVATQDSYTHRVCGTCGERKPVEEFYKDGKDSKGNPKYRRDCKECYKVARMREAERRHKNEQRRKSSR
jgi:hypothetical protein